MFGKQNKEKHNLKKVAYDRVLQLHNRANFLCYINDAYLETYQGKECVKLEGVVAVGTGKVTDRYHLYDCNGCFKAEVTMDELYLGNNKVESLCGGDKKVALYPVEQDVPYIAGDLLCIEDSSI